MITRAFEDPVWMDRYALLGFGVQAVYLIHQTQIDELKPCRSNNSPKVAKSKRSCGSDSVEMLQ